MDMLKALLFYGTLFLLIFAICLNSQYFDYDLWARLIAGMGVIDGGGVLKSDFLSYTPVHTWYDHEWGSGVVFYALLKHFGPFSLVILESMLYFGIFFVISRTIALRTGSKPYNIIFYIFPIMAVAENFNQPVRCHLFSFLFFAVFLYILELARKDRNKALFLIPPMVILWNNLHGGVVSGIGLLIIYAVGELLNRKPFAKYIYTLAASVPLLIINPWGIEYIKFLLMANTMKRPEIMEWWGIFSKFYLFKLFAFKIFMAVIIAVESLTILKKRNIENFWAKLDKTKFILLALTLYLAITKVKLLPFFVITGTVFGYEDFYKLVQNKNLPSWKNKAVYTALILMSVMTFTLKEISIPLNMNIYPVKEVEFVKINKLRGKILTNFGMGSYVSYKLYPQNLIYMDGRYEEVYYEGMVQLLKKFYLALPYWDEILEKFPPDIMIIEKDYPIFGLLNNNEDWAKIYDGKKFGVFTRKELVKPEYIQPSDDIKYYKDTLFDTDIKFKKRV